MSTDAPMGISMVSVVISHINATRIGWHLWEIDLRFAPGLPASSVGVELFSFAVDHFGHLHRKVDVRLQGLLVNTDTQRRRVLRQG